ncbi:VWA domain-containing protein [Chloroflexota bacterium]
MFTDFFYVLKKRNVPVSLTEWMTFIQALAGGYITNLDSFYHLGRSILVKNEAYFDHYDIAFQEYFRGVEAPAKILQQVLDWLGTPLAFDPQSKEAQAVMEGMEFDELLKQLEERLKEQTEQHDGGSKWVGRGGTSPFGHSGYHPGGIRIGGQSRNRSAVQIAAERRFRNYRNDLTLDIRQIKLALKGLRELTRVGPEDELNLNETIKSTAKNAGDIELVWQRRRKNTIKLLLLMDVGGSMDPFAELCSQLFSAAHSSSHFRDFQYYYFHNCVYDNLYTDMERNQRITTDHILHTLDPDYKVIMVGDARMASYEITHRWGAIDYYERNETPGAEWLRRMADHFRHTVWLNPDEERYWVHPTVRFIGQLHPMFPLTVEGLAKAVKSLVSKENTHPTTQPAT